MIEKPSETHNQTGPEQHLRGAEFEGSGTGAPLLPQQVSDDAHRQIGWWLVAIACLLSVLVLVGGATRLTDSGLSITEWKPVTGIIPPLSLEDWQSEFEKYKQIPEYDQVNFGMSLDEFKTIYWWEWLHRFIGRMLGFAFFFPFVYFLIKRKVSRALFPKLLAMFILGGAQGALGWFMVMSGLSDRIDVSQYRLAAHLGLAFFILGFILWVAFELLLKDERHETPTVKPLIQMGHIMVVLVYAQIVLGGFVAGLHAGLIYNDWPWMNGQLFPEGYFFMSPWYVNFFENLATVQFNHRLVAYALTIMALWFYIRSRHFSLSPSASMTRHLLLATVLIQVALGIWTLMAAVPLWLGLLHQAGALLAFTASIAFTQALRKMEWHHMSPEARA